VNGRTITTTVFPSDLRANGIAHCDPVARLELEHGTADPVEALGAFLNLATICNLTGRTLDVVAAFRSARRIAPQLTEIGDSIAWLIGKCPRVVRFGPSYVAPDFTIVARDWSREHFDALYAPYRSAIGAGPASDPRLDDVSFHVLQNERLVATVPLVVNASGLARWEAAPPNDGYRPARIHVRDDRDAPDPALEVIREYLFYVMRAYGVRETLLEEPRTDRFALYRALDRGDRFRTEIWTEPAVELAQTETEIFDRVSAGYRAQIQWCRQHLVIDHYADAALDDEVVHWLSRTLTAWRDPAAPNAGAFDRERFTTAIAACRAHRGEVTVVKSPSGEACAIAVNVDTGDSTSYALGGGRARDDKNPSAFAVYDSIVRSKRRGMRRYQTSDVLPPPMRFEGRKLVVDTLERNADRVFATSFSDARLPVYVYGVQANAGTSAEAQVLAMTGILAGRRFDAEMDVETEAIVTLDRYPSSLGESMDHAKHYVSTPIAEIESLLDLSPLAPETTTFLDIGAGKGRPVLLAAARPFKRVVGVEIAPFLCEVARANLRRYRGELACNDVSFVESDIAKFELPDGDLLVFMYSPFTDVVLEPLVARLAERRAKTVILYHAPVHREVIDRRPEFRRLEGLPVGFVYAAGYD
jgi:hypothetical protein